MPAVSSFHIFTIKVSVGWADAAQDNTVKTRIARVMARMMISCLVDGFRYVADFLQDICINSRLSTTPLVGDIYLQLDGLDGQAVAESPGAVWLARSRLRPSWCATAATASCRRSGSTARSRSIPIRPMQHTRKSVGRRSLGASGAVQAPVQPVGALGPRLSRGLELGGSSLGCGASKVVVSEGPGCRSLATC